MQKGIKSLVCLLIFHLSSGVASLNISSKNEIVGEKPTLTNAIEDKITNLDLFGIHFTDVNNNNNSGNYYGDKDIRNLPINPAYPFKKLFKPATLLKQPVSEYFDSEGDQFGELTLDSTPTVQWLYTDKKGKEVVFVPGENDTFCSLAAAGKYTAPYKYRITSKLKLTSKYGIPRSNSYPNETVTQIPEKTYTILNDSGICWARPASLKPDQASKDAKKHEWDSKKGFLVQSSSSSSLNFPQTAFYGAKFDLLLASNGLVHNYDWRIAKGSQLITFELTNDVVTINFNTSTAKNDLEVWKLVTANDQGYEVIIEGTHKTSGNKIYYPFRIKKWFTGWSERYSQAADAKVIDTACAAKGKNQYKITALEDLVGNAAVIKGKNDSVFYRKIGALVSEWGLVSQELYPNSWAPAGKAGPNTTRRLWLTYDGDYCDLHLYDAAFHCKNEKQNKNGVCVSYK